tara:strand:- start:106 stop:288 length:183 start_codon:yes stop_codon:yes gene_type:complete
MFENIGTVYQSINPKAVAIGGAIGYLVFTCLGAVSDILSVVALVTLIVAIALEVYSGRDI